MKYDKVKFIVNKQDTNNKKLTPKIKPETSKPHFCVENYYKNNNVLSSPNKKINKNMNKNKTKSFKNKHDSFSIEIMEENPSNINKYIYNFDFNLRDKDY